jgi:hypothetical protein
MVTIVSLVYQPFEPNVPDVTDAVVVGAAVSVVHVKVGLGAPTLPALSIARTAKLWAPSAGPESVAGLVAVIQVVPLLVEYCSALMPEFTPPADVSVPEKTKVAEFESG